MSLYFIESKQPIFVSFNRMIQNQETDLDFELFLKELQENFENDQQDGWIKYWNKQGEEEVLRKWNEKYKDYLKEVQDYSDVTETYAIGQEGTTILETNSEETCEVDDDLNNKFWEDLWQKHRQEIYCEQYLIFSTIYYNYFLELNKSCENKQQFPEEYEDSEHKQSDTSKLAEELEQLAILGLPTSFGGRPQNSSKKNIKKSINYSDFFSDSEMENESNESYLDDYEDNSTVESKESPESLHSVQKKNLSNVQKRKRNRKLKNVPSFILEEKGLLKYWRKRFSLFSRFDEGIRLDRESWFSVTPEKVAKHLAERLKCSMIVDGFCGGGGNAIQFALTCDKVIAIDIDPIKLEMAKHNAKIYNVSHKIEFILGDFLQMAAGGKLKADVVFLSPPWGGPKYKNKKEYDIEKYLLPVEASELVKASRNISENIALFLPRNSSVKQIIRLAGVGKRCEIEHNYLDSRLVAITALYGEDILTKEAKT